MTQKTAYLKYEMEESQYQALQDLVGTDGIERIIAISRIVKEDKPFLMACRLLNLGIGVMEARMGKPVLETKQE